MYVFCGKATITRLSARLILCVCHCKSSSSSSEMLFDGIMVEISSFFLIMPNHFIMTLLLYHLIYLIQPHLMVVVLVVSVEFISGSDVLSNLLFLMCISSVYVPRVTLHPLLLLRRGIVSKKYKSFPVFFFLSRTHANLRSARSFVVLFATCHELCTHFMCEMFRVSTV